MPFLRLIPKRCMTPLFSRLMYCMKTRLCIRMARAGAFCIALFVHNPAAQAAELIMFESPICEWCDEWHAVIGPIYPLTPEGKCAPLRTVDIYEARPDELQHIGGIRYTPTFVLVEDGREVGRILGYAGEDFFWPLLAENLGKLSTSCVGNEGA